MADQNSKVVKARRATIDIGGITINVYQLPDGSYRLSGRNVTDAIGESSAGLTRHYGTRSLEHLPVRSVSMQESSEALRDKGFGDSTQKPKNLKPLQGKDSERFTTRSKINPGKDGSPFWELTIEEAIDYWAAMAVKGNKIALELVKALAIETIERRADRVFHIQRAEADYDAALKVRVGSIRHRKEFVKEIQDFCDRKESKSDGDQWAIKNATDRIYRILIGADSKRLREIHGLPPSTNIREWLHESGQVDALDLLSAVETFAAIRVSRGESPLEAIALVATPYQGALAHLCQVLSAHP